MAVVAICSVVKNHESFTKASMYLRAIALGLSMAAMRRILSISVPMLCYACANSLLWCKACLVVVCDTDV